MQKSKEIKFANDGNCSRSSGCSELARRNVVFVRWDIAARRCFLCRIRRFGKEVLCLQRNPPKSLLFCKLRGIVFLISRCFFRWIRGLPYLYRIILNVIIKIRNGTLNHFFVFSKHAACGSIIVLTIFRITTFLVQLAKTFAWKICRLPFAQLTILPQISVKVSLDFSYAIQTTAINEIRFVLIVW